MKKNKGQQQTSLQRRQQKQREPTTQKRALTSDKKEKEKTILDCSTRQNEESIAKRRGGGWRARDISRPAKAVTPAARKAIRQRKVDQSCLQRLCSEKQRGNNYGAKSIYNLSEPVRHVHDLSPRTRPFRAFRMCLSWKSTKENANYNIRTTQTHLHVVTRLSGTWTEAFWSGCPWENPNLVCTWDKPSNPACLDIWKIMLHCRQTGDKEWWREINISENRQQLKDKIVWQQFRIVQDISQLLSQNNFKARPFSSKRREENKGQKRTRQAALACYLLRGCRAPSAKSFESHQRLCPGACWKIVLAEQATLFHPQSVSNLPSQMYWWWVSGSAVRIWSPTCTDALEFSKESIPGRMLLHLRSSNLKSTLAGEPPHDRDRCSSLNLSTITALYLTSAPEYFSLKLANKIPLPNRPKSDEIWFLN